KCFLFCRTRVLQSPTLFPYTTLFRSYSLMKGFFERASCPRRKTAHIHVRRPPGLQTCGNAVGSLDAKATATATAIAPTARLLLRSEEHTSELQSRENLVCRLLLEKKK